MELIQKLLELTNDDLLEVIVQNQQLIGLVDAALYTMLGDGEVPENSIFEAAIMCYERDKKAYSFFGKIDAEHVMLVQVTSPDDANIVRGEDEILHVRFVLPPLRDKIALGIKTLHARAESLETSIVRSYTNEVRYGDIDYLESDFKQFAKKSLNNVSDLKGKDVYERLPLKFNYKGRLVEYLTEHQGNINNVHVV